MEEKEKDQLIQTKSVSSREVTICHISDTHNRHKRVAVPECDILICSGDISGMGNKGEVEDFFKWFSRQYQASYRVLVAGNHDLSFDGMKFPTKYKPDWLQELIYDYELPDNNFYLENEMKEVMGVKIWGSPYSSWFHGDRWAFNVHRGADSHALYSTIPLGVDIVVTHGPPFGKNDWCNDISGPVGCEDLRKHINRTKPLLHLFGHIHESYGFSMDIDTYYFNGAICNLQYEPVNEPWLIKANFDEREIEILNSKKL